MMLPSDLELKDDIRFKGYSLKYMQDNELLCRDFAMAFKKLTELGFR